MTKLYVTKSTFAAFLILTLSLAWVLVRFLRERLSGNPFTLSNPPE